jgi:hypothetical protein
MAFLTLPDISSRLPTGYDTELVVDLLAQIQSELANLGFTFTGFTTATRQIHCDIYGQSIWDLLPFASLSSVKIKQFNSSSETVLVANEDYRIVEHSYVDGIYTRLELISRYRRDLKDPQYLELIGSWGFMSSVPADLKGAIVRYIQSQLSYQKQGYRTIIEAKTGDSMTKFTDNQQEFVNTILEYKPFLSILSKYRLC